MKIYAQITSAIILVSLYFLPVIAGAAEQSSDAWQITRLFHPNQADLKGEAKGRVMIYDGVTDKVVEKALDEQFDRVGSMMFTSVIVTDEQGEPARDPDTGNIITEEDGCD